MLSSRVQGLMVGGHWTDQEKSVSEPETSPGLWILPLLLQPAIKQVKYIIGQAGDIEVMDKQTTGSKSEI